MKIRSSKLYPAIVEDMVEGVVEEVKSPEFVLE